MPKSVNFCIFKKMIRTYYATCKVTGYPCFFMGQYNSAEVQQCRKKISSKVPKMKNYFNTAEIFFSLVPKN